MSKKAGQSALLSYFFDTSFKNALKSGKLWIFDGKFFKKSRLSR
jgi:hypothetical protein